MRINPDIENVLFTDRLELRVLDASSAKIVLEYYKKNKEHFADALPELADDFYTVSYQIDRFWQEYNLMLRQLYIRYYIFLGDNLIGDICISNIEPYVTKSCIISYKLDKQHQGYGYANEAMSEMINHLFQKQDIHRIEALILPENKPSIKVIEKLGFHKESIARSYVKIKGVWRDHLRYVLINEEN